LNVVVWELGEEVDKMANEHQTWNVSQNLEHLWVNVLEYKVVSFA